METQMLIGAGAYAWDDYQARMPYESDRWATTDRGWCQLMTHPEADLLADYSPGMLNVGNYLDYGPTGAPHPDGRAVHATAYVYRMDRTTRVVGSALHLGAEWCASVTDARAWVEATVDAYLRRVGQ